MRDLPYLARTDNDVSSFSGLLWRRAIQTERWLVYSAKVARCCFFEDCNWFNWEENGILCPNSKHLWGDQTGRCYTWSIKKPKLSKMNSTCSMKAWHRCVSLWGPPGRLCTASWVVETGFKSAFPPSIPTVITNWLGVRTLSAKPSERPEPVDSILPVFIWRRKDPRPWHWSQ